MFHTLIASAPQRQPSRLRFLLSVLLHAVAVAAAVAATRPIARAAPAALREPALVFVPPRSVAPSTPSLPRPLPAGPAPALTLHEVLEAPRLSVGELTPSLPSVGDLLNDPPLRIGPSGAPVPDAGGTALGGPWTADSVDDPVEILAQAPVRYPPDLAQAAIAGRVELEFVVDTSGRVERDSFRTLVSSRPEFEAAARAAILDTRYRPARARGHAVRQLVRQTLSFRAESGRLRDSR